MKEKERNGYNALFVITEFNFIKGKNSEILFLRINTLILIIKLSPQTTFYKINKLKFHKQRLEKLMKNW